MSEKNENNIITAEQYLNGVISVHNYNDTYGLIVLNNGIVLRASSLFEYFREQWNMYNMLLEKAQEEQERNEENEEQETEALQELNEFLELTDNGILSNDELEVKVQEISAMVAEYRQMEILKEIKKRAGQDEEDESFND
jgi:hypothetical protein